MKDYAKERKTDLIIAFVTTIFVAFFVNLFFVFKDQKQTIISSEKIPNTSTEESLIATKKQLEDNVQTNDTSTATLPSDTTAQMIIEDWANSTNGTKSIILYDIEYDEIVGEYNPKEEYNIASLYKLFVVYEGYNKIKRKEWQPDDITVGYTIRKCLDLSIRESYSPCAESLWEAIGNKNLDNIYQEMGKFKHTNISDIVSTPEDILEIMKLYYDYEDSGHPELIKKMWDSFLNQPETTYNWRQGLPSGFSKKTRVYNKVGWNYDEDNNYWDVYHDAAIIETANRHHYIIIVMTSQVNPERIGELGKQLEEVL